MAALMSNRGVAVSVAAAVLIVAGAGAFWKRPSAPPTAGPRDSVAQVGDIMIAERSAGSPDAPVVIYEFSDFQCPYCRRFWKETMPTLRKEYVATGKVRLVFLNYPLAEVHANAPAAHNFAMCAARQNRFWKTHDLLFEHQNTWEAQKDPARFFNALADSAALDRKALATCLSKKAEDWLIQAETREALGAGITGTPAFVVNGGLLAGAQPMEVWRPILDSIYRAAKASGK
jgi:protein-disulfide isomerase